MDRPSWREAVAPWIERSRSDLRMARAALDLEPPEIEASCFHSQQAVEKELKAPWVIVDRIPDGWTIARLCKGEGPKP